MGDTGSWPTRGWTRELKGCAMCSQDPSTPAASPLPAYLFFLLLV